MTVGWTKALFKCCALLQDEQCRPGGEESAGFSMTVCNRRFIIFVCSLLLISACSTDTLYGVGGDSDSSLDGSLVDPAPVEQTTPPTGGGDEEVDVPTHTPSFMLWVEQPTIDKREGYFEEFYEGLADFINDNPAGIRINKVLVRFLDAGDESW